MSPDDREKLEEALEQEYPETFVFDDTNNKLIGVFVRVDTGPSEYGPVPIAVLEDGGKEYGVWMFHAVLRNQFAQVKPRVGELVGVKYLGKKMGASGRQYANYVVKRIPDASAEAFDWDAIADETAVQDMAPAQDSPSLDNKEQGWTRGATPSTAEMSPTGEY